MVNFIKTLGIVKSANVDFDELLWEELWFQINKLKNITTKHEIIQYPRFTKIIIRHLLSHNPNLKKCLDSTPHNISEEARLEKLMYVAKGEPRGKPTFGMPILEVMMSREIKELDAYMNYLTEYPHAQSCISTLRKGQYPYEAFKYAKLVNVEENQQRETERRSKQRHARIVLERQVNKEVDEGYQHLKVKLKDMEQPSPEAQLLLNLKRQIK
ncbi:hypothetical protein Tco_1037267 [Tanacetum coccineum]